MEGGMMLIRIYGWRNIHTDEWYIGQTSLFMEIRAGKNGGKYFCCPKFGEAIKKYGWPSFEENILRLCDTKEEADYWEKYYIKKYNSVEKGYNTSIGGAGKPGVYSSHPEETRKKMSDIHKRENLSAEIRKRISESKMGTKNPMYGKHLSEEHRRKMSEAHKGFKHTEESKKRMKKAQEYKRKPVCQYSLDNEFIREYPSARDAALELGIWAQSIGKVCMGKLNQTGGYLWRYA